MVDVRQRGGTHFLAGGGETGALLRDKDWSASPAGPPEAWPAVVKALVAAALASPAPMIVWIGTTPDALLQIYNDAYRPIMGTDRHPGGLGGYGRLNWPEIWDIMSPLFAEALGGTAVLREDQRMIVRRNGPPEEAWFTHAHSPIRDEAGAVVGVLTVVTETTQRMRAAKATATERLEIQGLADALPVLISYLRVEEDGELSYRFVNRAYDRWFAGRTLEDVAGRRVRDVLGPAAYAVVEPYVAQALGGSPVSFERFMPYASGDRRHIRGEFIPRRRTDGSVEGVYSLVQDVTAFKEAERAQGFLLRLGDVLHGLDDAERIQAEACSLLAAHLDVSQVGLGEVDPEAGVATVRRDWMDGAIPSVTGVWRMEDFGQAVASDLRRGVAAAVADVAADPRTDAPEVLAAYAAIHVKAVLVAPLTKAGRVVGVLFVHHAEPRVWSANDIALVEETGARLWDAIERARAEQALHASEERLRLATDNAEIGFWDVDVVNDRLIWPARVKAMFGISPDVPVSMADFYAGLHPEDREHTGAVYAAAADPARRALYDVEYRTVGKEDGLVRWVAAKGRGVFDEAGRCVRVIGTAIDITRRKEDEAALRKSEARLRTINADLERQVAERTLARGRVWQLTPDLMGVLNSEGFWEASNPAWLTLLGWSEAEVASTVFFDFIHRDDQARTQAAWADAQERGLPAIHFENRYRTKAGAWRWLSWVAVPENGKVYCIARDVTPAKAQAAALVERTAERDRVWTNSRDLLVVVGADGVFRAVNPAWSAILGHPPEEVIGRSFRDFVWPEDAELTRRGLEEAFSVADLTNFENRFTHVDGTPRWVSWHSSREGDFAYGYGRDVTAEKERQAELEAAQDQLRQAQKMEAVGQLTGGIAHDFNNLLGAVVGSLDLIRRRPSDVDRVLRYAEAGLQAAERGARLTGQLLAFSRAQRIEQRPIVVSDLLDGVRGLLASTLGPAVALRLDHACEGAVLSDRTQLEMAVLNLAINARDAMPQGGELAIAARPLEVGKDPELPAGDYIEIAVSDTGVGMPPEVAARAFDPFFTTKGVGKGTGLGLSQVYGVARQTGGTVRIESRPGEGSTVRLLLPRIASPEAARPAGGVDAPETRAPGETILVVDDDQDVRRMLVASLEALGYAVMEAADGPAGLAALAQTTPDLIMVDFAMPGMTGAEMARAVRETRPGLPIVFASGYADTAAIESAVGPDALLLRKPFRVDDLQAVLAVALA